MRATPDLDFRDDVLAGLSAAVPAVPARWLYDERGSELFDAITKLPSYYPTATETALLEKIHPELSKHIPAGAVVVEFGSGSSTKTPLLLDAVRPAAYVPIDISGEFLRESAAALASDFPKLSILPVEADFMFPIEPPAEIARLPKLGFFPGSTIGNMVPRTAVDLLRSMRLTLQADHGVQPMLLIGMDLVKDPAVLVAAYDDAKGVTADFNCNLIHRINRELGGTIPLDALRHVARWEDDFARVEMHLEATRAITFEVSGESFAMAEGETIHTENSHKFTRRSANLLLQAAGWTPRKRWLDSAKRFSLILAEATQPRNAP